MCGIIGYTGRKQASKVLIEGLKKLEYRGYDSAGIAVGSTKGIEIVKAEGKLEHLTHKIKELPPLVGVYGIGHTRWATHGVPSEKNSHPHVSSKGRVTVVHNGIIENYFELKTELEKKGFFFVSDTDTEVIANLIDWYYLSDPLEALNTATKRLSGSFAIAVMFTDKKGELFAAKKSSPLLIGEGENENLLASDVTALLGLSAKIYYLKDGEFAVVTDKKIEFYNSDLKKFKKKAKEQEVGAETVEKGCYPHFMLKEIHEEVMAVKDTLQSRIDGDKILLSGLNLTKAEIKVLKRIYVVACGSAYHAASIYKVFFESFAKIPTECYIASEFRYGNVIFEENSLVIAISQSGETADTLAALKKAKECSVKTLAVVNVRSSSIAREADGAFYTYAGAEIAVATTKAYLAQIAAGCILAVAFSCVRGKLSGEKYNELLSEMKKLPDKIERELAKEEEIKQLAKKLISYKDVFFIGKSVDYATAMEGSLKLKEISYLRSEAYPAGELKHGAISLITKKALVVGISTSEEINAKTVSNLTEVKARGGIILGVGTKDNKELKKISDYYMEVEEGGTLTMPILGVIPLQLFSYYTALELSLDVDKPRNLAKSVTVE